MALTEYKKKRSFSKTPEPEGGNPSGAALHFVVQKHAASHLHYDFRLEMKGVLKSWAIPKGPSLNPADKRLAMMVEDHPYNYKDFEGVIPPGNYGAGTVIVWDEGTYEPLGMDPGASKTAQEKALLSALKAGSLKIVMHGKKLKGEFALVHTHGMGENGWLLIKHKDQYATTKAVIDQDKSVVSDKTLEQVAHNPNAREWKSRPKAGPSKGVPPKVAGPSKGAAPKAQVSKVASKRAAAPKVAKPKATPKTAPSKAAGKDAAPQATTHKATSPAVSLSPAGRKAPMPKDLEPMLATLVDNPFDAEGWLYEIKFDGYRALSYLKKGQVEFRSRNNKSFNEKFYPVYEALRNWGVNAVVDGEVVVMNNKGLSGFNELQNWRSEADGLLAYYLFDLLWLDGKDVMRLPLDQRRALLKSIVPADNDVLRMSEDFDTSGTTFFASARKLGLEGIVAKKAGSVYTPGARSRDWLKIKTSSRQEVVIGGYTKNAGSNKAFSSLLVGVFEKGKLQYTGKIGTGFSDRQQQEMLLQFKPLIIKKSPFSVEPDINKPSRFRPDPPEANAVWLKPQLLCEVSFREMTPDGVMRHPSFEGMRIDKAPKDVRRETPVETKKVVKDVKPAVAKPAAAKPAAAKTAAAKPASARAAAPAADKLLAPPGAPQRKSLLNPTDESQVRKVNGHDISFTNLSKVFWPKEKITKRDLLNYYYQVAPTILPYLKDRPQSLNRYPNGIEGKSFYQKDVTGKVPDWIQTFPYHSEGEDREKHFLVCSDEASLLYIASLGCIELNPWSSRIQSPENPDWCIIDLDPSDKTPFDKVIEVAQVTKTLLDAIGISSYCKTSGSTGIHIYFPLGAKYTYEHSKEFARAIVSRVQSEIPNHTSIERMVGKRNGKLYLDFLQNRPQATIAAPYSIRPKPGATASAPLAWEEVKKGLTMKDFTLKNMPRRIQGTGDLFSPVLGKGIDMAKALKSLNGL